MIHVSQGHEKGIGLEVFFKSLLCLESSLANKFMLHAVRETVEENLTFLGVNYYFEDEFLKFENRNLHFKNVSESESPQSTTSLESCINDLKKGDILVTLPTSKDQLVFQNNNYSGYTEYFRNRFNNQNLVMVFKGVQGYTALLSDHIPLKDVSNFLKPDLITHKMEVLFTHFSPNNFEYVVAGINPHSGENGLLGDEEKVLIEAIKYLQTQNKALKIKGPLPGDTLHFEKGFRQKKIFVYSFHDQGLPVFKEVNGLLGINMTLGLPFIRLSVDHGTAFHLYSKNKASFKGCHFVLKEALGMDS